MTVPAIPPVPSLIPSPVHPAAAAAAAAARRSSSCLYESYVDSMYGRRTLADVLAQIDGMGPSRRLPRRRKRRTSEVSLMNAETSRTDDDTPEEALPVFVRQ
jgi:hypothetical protein